MGPMVYPKTSTRNFYQTPAIVRRDEVKEYDFAACTSPPPPRRILGVLKTQRSLLVFKNGIKRSHLIDPSLVTESMQKEPFPQWF